MAFRKLVWSHAGSTTVKLLLCNAGLIVTNERFVLQSSYSTFRIHVNPVISVINR
jgi:hypothetical protein